MTVVDKLYQDLLQYKSVLDGQLEAIKQLTEKFEVINLKTTFHYDLLEKAVVENVGKYKIMDVDVSGKNKADIIPISDSLEILGFRLGRTFNEPLFLNNQMEFLGKWYEEHHYDDFTYYIHKSSEVNPELIEATYDFGYEVFDKMMINSIFGQVYYFRQD